MPSEQWSTYKSLFEDALSKYTSKSGVPTYQQALYKGILYVRSGRTFPHPVCPAAGDEVKRRLTLRDISLVSQSQAQAVT